MGNPLGHIESAHSLAPHTGGDGTLRTTAHPDVGSDPLAFSSYAISSASNSVTCPNLNRKLLGDYLDLPLSTSDTDAYYAVVQKALAKLEKIQKYSSCGYINDVLQFSKIHDRFDKTARSRTEFLLLVLSIIQVESSGSITATGSSGNGLMQLILRYVGSSLFVIARNNHEQLPFEFIQFFESHGIARAPSYAELQEIRRATLAKKTGAIDKFVKRFAIRKMLTHAPANVILGTHLLGFLLSRTRRGTPVSVKSAIYNYNGSKHASAYVKEVMAVLENLQSVIHLLPEGPVTFTPTMPHGHDA